MTTTPKPGFGLLGSSHLRKGDQNLSGREKTANVNLFRHRNETRRKAFRPHHYKRFVGKKLSRRHQQDGYFGQGRGGSITQGQLAGWRFLGKRGGQRGVKERLSHAQDQSSTAEKSSGREGYQRNPTALGGTKTQCREGILPNLSR